MTRRPALAIVVGALALSLALPAVPAPAAPPVTLESQPPLFAELRAADGAEVRPGDPVAITGRIARVDAAAGGLLAGVPATFHLRVTDPTGAERATFGPFTAGLGGEVAETLPGSVTEGVTAPADAGHVATLSVRAVGLSFAGLTVDAAGAAELSVSVPPTFLELDNAFVSSVGWVKPNETYPFRVLVRNHTRSSRNDAVVRVQPVKGMRFLRAAPSAGGGRASIEGGAIVWRIGTVPARTDAAPGLRTLVVLARAHDLKRDRRVVWRDLSTTAVLRYRHGPRGGIADRSHGPKVVPPGGAFETARYGDRPFPVVAAEYFDRAHEASHTAEGLAAIINSEDITGSTFNLYQEMSYGQLYPHATIPSATIGTAGWDVAWKSPRYRDSGFQFTELAPQGTCHGLTLSALADSPAYAERIVDGWYQPARDHRLLRGRPLRLRGDRSGRRQRVAVGHRRGVRADGEVGVRRGAHRRPRDRLLRLRHRQGRRRRLLHARVPRDRRERRLAGERGPAVRQHLAALVEPGVLLHRPRTGLNGYISDDQLKDLERADVLHERATA